MYPFHNQNQVNKFYIEVRAAKLERDLRGKDWLAQRFIDGELEFIVIDKENFNRVLPPID